MSITKRGNAAATNGTLGEITADNIHSLMQDMSAFTMGEISDLILELQTLRDKVLAECNRTEREVLGYARLSQSVIQLTTTTSQGTVAVQKPAVDDGSSLV